jgi:tyrosine-protein phosphatase SIW14
VYEWIFGGRARVRGDFHGYTVHHVGDLLYAVGHEWGRRGVRRSQRHHGSHSESTSDRGIHTNNGTMIFRSRFLASVLVALAVWAPASAQTPPQSTRPAPAQTAENGHPVAAVRVQLPGLPQFGTVSTQLYRGAQPKDRGFTELKKLGINIVVNLRHEPDEIARERSLVEQEGMQYVSIPWRGKQDPKTEQVAQFLNLLRTNSDKKVFVHCERGAERTGVMVACYRMSNEHWTPDQALNEMEAFRFQGLRFEHLKKFVRTFPTLLLVDPFLKILGQS